MSDVDVVRVYLWADAGPFLGGVSEAPAGVERVRDGGFGDNNLVFEIPRALWEQYTTAKDAFEAAQDEIESLERAADAVARGVS